MRFYLFIFFTMGRYYSLASQVEAISNGSADSPNNGLYFIYKYNGKVMNIQFYMIGKNIVWNGDWSTFIQGSLGITYLDNYEEFYKSIGVDGGGNHILGNYHTKEIHQKILVKICELYDSKRKKYNVKFASETEANKKGYVVLDSTYYGELEFARKDLVTEYEGMNFLSEDIITIDKDSDKETTKNVYIDGINMYYFVNGEWFSEMQRTVTYKSLEGNISILERNLKKTFPNAIGVGDYWYDKDYFLEKVGKYSEVLKKYYIGTGEIKGSSILQSYHTNHTNPVVRATGGNMFFGIELERSVEVRSADYKQLAKDGWRCEQDGSVAAEYISPVLSLDNIEESIDFIKSTAQPILDGNISYRCGGHIHVSVPGVDYALLGRKASVFMPLLWAIYPERASNSYSNRPPIEYNAYEFSGRSDLRMKPSIGTIEFRIFPGCKGEDMVRFRLTLLNIIITKALSFDEKPTFQEALDFILSSKEMFDVLSKVYNTSDKMKDISYRIDKCYKSVEGVDASIDVQASLAKAMEEFVANKVKNTEEEDDGREYSI